MASDLSRRTNIYTIAWTAYLKPICKTISWTSESGHGPNDSFAAWTLLSLVSCRLKTDPRWFWVRGSWMRLNRRRPLSAYIFVLINYIEGQASDDSEFWYFFKFLWRNPSSRISASLWRKKKERKKNHFLQCFIEYWSIFGDSRQCLQALRITQKL